MSRKVSLLVAVVLIGLILVGATLALITTNIEVANVVTIGKVDIEVVPPNQPTALVPGKPFVGEGIKVKNQGTTEAYVRVKLDQVSWNGVTGADNTLITAELLSNSDWVKDGEYYYYKQKLATNSSTPVLNTQITLNGAGTDEKYSAKDFKVDYKVEAIQADHIADYKQWPIGGDDIKVLP